MTIITKPISDKKLDKLEVPLVEYDQLDELPIKEGDIESPDPVDVARFVMLRARARKVSTTTTLCLLLTALMVVSIGIVGGTYLYRQYVRSQMHRFRGWCSIPYSNTKATMFLDQEANAQAAMLSESDIFRFYDQRKESNRYDLPDFFQEQFELDLENDSYEKIDVPDFRDGRQGRFIHDFYSNVTGIIDTDEKRCFVMPLNRNAVLPPRSLFDLIHKIWDGYYKVDTEVVRETMKVVTPPLKDAKTVGPYIARECRGLPIYQLVKYESNVFKRSADLDSGAKFALFSGISITKFDIVNLAEVVDYENKMAAAQS